MAISKEEREGYSYYSNNLDRAIPQDNPYINGPPSNKQEARDWWKGFNESRSDHRHDLISKIGKLNAKNIGNNAGSKVRRTSKRSRKSVDKLESID